MDSIKVQYEQLFGQVYWADAIQMLEDVGQEQADIIFLDPPFNLGKQYDDGCKIDSKPIDEYESWLTNVVDISISALKPGGALFIYHIPVWALRVGAYAERSLSLRHWISVSMKNGFARGKKLYPAHYALLYFTKGPPQYFRRPKLTPLRCRTCGEFVRDYGGYRKIIENSGINLSDIWDDLSPVRHRSTKHRSANELPFALFERIITISGDTGMTYVDPFAGSGSGAIAAWKHNLNFRVGDIVQENTNVILQRIADEVSARTRVEEG